METTTSGDELISHILSIYDGVEATTLALANTAAAGYHLLAYNPIDANYIDQRNASLYTPGDYSVMGKYGNIVETITVEIVGTSRDDMFVKLRALYRAIENARDYVQFPNQRNPSYLSYKPDSTTNTSYSCILGGRVDIPGTDANIAQGAGGEGEQLANTMTGIVITIEREAGWRNAAPVLAVAGATGIVSTTFASAWGKAAIASLPGDLPASTFISVAANAAETLDTLYIGTRSSKRGGANYANAGMIEAESGTYSAPADTSPAADATASPGGGGNTKLQCTFAGTPGNSKRCGLTPALGFGVYKVFLRARLSAAGSVTMYLQYAALGVGQYFLSNIVTITNTAWRMIEMGNVLLPPTFPIYREFGTAETYVYLYAARNSGACSLDLDFYYFMPVDECLVKIAGAAAVSPYLVNCVNLLPGIQGCNIVDSIGDPYISPQQAGAISLEPGNSEIYFLGGDANFANTLAPAAGYPFVLSAYYKYLTARGNG